MPEDCSCSAGWRSGPVAGGLRLAAIMLVGLYVDSCFGILQHGVFGPLGFAIRYCGPNSGAVGQMLELDDILNKPAMAGWAIGCLVWIFLALTGKACVPRWTIVFCPFLTVRLEDAALYVPAPLGMPLWGGWTNFAGAVFFAVLALTYRDSENAPPEAAAPVSAGATNSSSAGT